MVTEAAIHAALEKLPGWNYDASKKSLGRSLKFKNFRLALAFVNELGAIAETHKHHPDIAFGWGYCHITLTTHDAGGLTEKDLALAEAAQAIIPAS